MGKRARRRAREAGEVKEKKPKQRLGQDGPFMVCRECRNPLTLYSIVDKMNEYDEQKIVYIHCLEYIDGDGVIHQPVFGEPYDHEAVPVEGDPLSANTTCDFCHSPESRYVFVPRKPIRVDDPLGTGQQLDYSSPWNCCNGCLSSVKSKDVTKMLSRVAKSPYGNYMYQPPEIQQITRTMLKDLYAKYIASNPAGPYEVKIKPKAKPVGKPGSRRGM